MTIYKDAFSELCKARLRARPFYPRELHIYTWHYTTKEGRCSCEENVIRAYS
jgi:hypothetical protein